MNHFVIRHIIVNKLPAIETFNDKTKDIVIKLLSNERVSFEGIYRLIYSYNNYETEFMTVINMIMDDMKNKCIYPTVISINNLHTVSKHNNVTNLIDELHNIRKYYLVLYKDNLYKELPNDMKKMIISLS